MTKVVMTYEDELKEAFPAVDAGVKPFGSRVLVQFRTAKIKVGNIILTGDTRETEKWNTQVAKLLAVGPLAFKNRGTQATWPEGEWAQPGEFVRVPKHGGDKWEVEIPGREKGENAIFAVMNDLDLIGLITGNPLEMKAFI